MQPVIQVSDVSRAYGDEWAVRRVSFEVQRGQVVGLLGHNGAGKSTLLRMLVGVLEPSLGTVQIGGHDIVADRQRAQGLLGYLPESAPLYPDLAVWDYLVWSATLRGLEDPESAVEVACAAVGLEQRLAQRIGALSKGFRQRVGLAQAIVHKPDLLVLDEPTNGLDPGQIQGMRTLIRALADQTTVVVSTHILQEVEAVCDRVLMLSDGALVADASLASLTQDQGTRLQVVGEADKVTALWPDARPDDEGGHLIPGQESEAVLAMALEAGLRVRACAPHRRRLEDVFRDVQQEARS